MDTNLIKEIIEETINTSKVEILDTTGTGDHFNALIVSDIFEEMSLINRHKLVYKSLSQFLTKEIHALQLKTLTTKEYNNE